ncbi:MAG: tetratricopeptide repeat protein [Chitinispirillaceae bacterium]|nr:tetratricopeptide repeat protein [Chitinispirillaceae bacterium]
MNVHDPVPPDNDPFAGQNARAEALIEQGDLPLAAETLVDIVQKDPSNFHAFNNLGALSWKREKWQDAYVMFKKAVDLRPDYTDALVNLFDAAIKLKKVQDVLPCFEQAAALNPADEEIRLILKAIRDLGSDMYATPRALALGFFSPVIDEADKELDAGNLNSAARLYLKSNDEEGPSAEAFSGLGVVSYYQQRYEDAYSLFVEAIKINPSKSDQLLNLLDSAKACGKTGQAKEIFEICASEHPALEEFRKEFEGF